MPSNSSQYDSFISYDSAPTIRRTALGLIADNLFVDGKKRLSASWLRFFIQRARDIDEVVRAKAWQILSSVELSLQDDTELAQLMLEVFSVAAPDNLSEEIVNLMSSSFQNHSELWLMFGREPYWSKKSKLEVTILPLIERVYPFLRQQDESYSPEYVGPIDEQ